MRLRSVLAAAALASLLALPGSAVALSPADPVVIQGSQAQRLLGAAPDRVVAFRWRDGWRQVPVQVDERAVVLLRSAYGPADPPGGDAPVPVLTYTDPGTFIGPDPDRNLDGNDEIALMYRDAGPRARGGADPDGVQAGSGVELALSDPRTEGRRYLYLFRTPGGRTPAAGRDYVDYDFVLASGDYKSTYRLEQGPNPEDSWVRTPSYSHHFADRWISDQIRVTTPGSTGTDILDRHKFSFGPGQCGRSEDTFTFGEGAFVVNRDGPVRALRSYIGANSGPYVQRTHLFYEGREDIHTDVRVHGISGGIDFFDYSPAAAGMTYRNNVDFAGVPLDGVPEALSEAYHPWESVSGPQGGLSIVHRFETNIPNLRLGSYWFDDSTPNPAPGNPEYQCTGDPFSFGSSGPRMIGPIPNTDPSYPPEGPAFLLRFTRHLYFEERGAPAIRGAERMVDVFTPFTARGLPRARIFARLDRKRRGDDRRITLRGTVCPRPGAGTTPVLQRRLRGAIVSTRRLRFSEGGPATCRAFAPLPVRRPGSYRVVISSDELQSGGVSRTMRIASRR